MVDLSALDNVLAWAESRPDLTYRPGPTVGAFLTTVQRLALLIAANQVGKTVGLCKWAVDQCLSYTGEGPGVLLAMVADLENIYPAFCAKLAEVTPWSELHEQCRYIEGKGFFVHARRGWKLRSGARIEFRGGKGEQMSVASLTCDLGAIVDEIPFRQHFSEVLRACQRYMSPVRVGFTAVGRPADWFRERVEGLDGRPPGDVNADGSPMWAVFRAGLTKTECPWLSEEQIETIYAQVDPDERPQRLEGAWEGPTSDRFFACMTSACVVDRVPEGAYTKVIVPVDHGEGAGHQFALTLLWDGSRIVIGDEYVNDRATTPEQDAPGIVAMLARLDMHPAMVDEWVGDSNSSGKSGAGHRVNDDLARAIGTLVGAPSLVRFRVPNKAPGSVNYGRRLLNYALGRGDLLVCARAARMVRALWHHREDGDEYTHAVDALRYGAVDLLRHRPEYQGIVWRVG